MKKHGKAILLPLMLTLILSSCHAPADKSSCPPGTTVRHAAVPADSPRCADRSFIYKDYQVDLFSLWTGRDGQVQAPCLVVSKANREIYRLDVGKDDTLELLYPNEMTLNELAASPIVDLTDDATQPNFVLMHFCPTKSNQCYVFSLGQNFKKMASLALQGDTAKLVLVDEGNKRKLVVPDSYKDFGIQAPAPEVVLTWQKNKFILDQAEMKKRCRDSTDCIGFRDSITESFKSMGLSSGTGPAELTDQIVDFYYGGQAKKARHFLDQSWPSKVLGKELYWAYITSEIKASPFWPQLKEMNGI